jgi:hypothetical protein
MRRAAGSLHPPHCTPSRGPGLRHGRAPDVPCRFGASVFLAPFGALLGTPPRTHWRQCHRCLHRPARVRRARVVRACAGVVACGRRTQPAPLWPLVRARDSASLSYYKPCAALRSKVSSPSERLGHTPSRRRGRPRLLVCSGGRTGGVAPVAAALTARGGGPPCHASIARAGGPPARPSGPSPPRRGTPGASGRPLAAGRQQPPRRAPWRSHPLPRLNWFPGACFCTRPTPLPTSAL